MDLRQQYIKRDRQIAKEYAQVTFDDDYIVKDNKPDILKVICAAGDVLTEEIKTINEAVWISGRVNFYIIYRSDTGSMPERIDGMIPFQEKIFVDNLTELNSVKVTGKIDDIMVSIINSRKVSVKGIISFEVTAEEMEEFPITGGMEEGEKYQEKVSEQELLELRQMKHDVMRIKTEIQLPKTKGNIANIICSYLDVRNLDKDLGQEKLTVRGEVYYCVIYQSEEGEMEWVDGMTSVTGDMKNDNPDFDLYWVKLNMTQQDIEAEMDYDREMRQLAIELVFDVELESWKTERVEKLDDVYSLSENIEPDYTMEEISELLIKNQAKCRMFETINLDQGQEKILQICGAKSHANIERTSLCDHGVMVEGVLELHIMYITADDVFPIAHRYEQLPFEQCVDVNDVTESTQIKLESDVEQIQINLLDNMTYEIKAVVNINLLAIEKKQIEVINSVKKIEEDKNQKDDIPGMVGYTTKPDETLWDVAKRYKTTIEKILEINDLKTDNIKGSEKIIIAKNVRI